MKIKYLGTSAAEGFPAVFCNCEHCREAKVLKGKNIRTRSQAIINDDLLIDLTPDTYSHFLNNNIDGDKIKYLLVTHSHPDHFYPYELDTRRVPCACDMREERLKIYCSKGAAIKMDQIPALKYCPIDYEALSYFETICMGDYNITTLPAKHFESDGSLLYVISQNGKNVLYAHDTGYFHEEVLDYIKEKGLTFDLVSLDCTNVDIPVDDNGGHMGLDNINRLVVRLKEMGAITDKTKTVISHFSHNTGPLQHRLEKRVEEYGYIVAFDGMSINLD